ncbi:MAG: helix-hairpin-helix domain-containing protein [Oscillospiraceae bacterium]|jgi:competence ComEA-like helix-hairpin-helix protein|nr:helix-hairpin-helix domain-containing protein [Oscillospiraceae bacterium]
MDKRHLPYNVLLVIALVAVVMMAICDFGLRRSSFAVAVGYRLPEPEVSQSEEELRRPYGYEEISGEDYPEEGPDIEVEFPLDLNAATFEELIFVPGIGEALAGRIIAYRNELGGAFSELGQLTEVSGIGVATLSKIAPYLFL